MSKRDDEKTTTQISNKDKPKEQNNVQVDNQNKVKKARKPGHSEGKKFGVAAGAHGEAVVGVAAENDTTLDELSTADLYGEGSAEGAASEKSQEQADENKQEVSSGREQPEQVEKDGDKDLLGGGNMQGEPLSHDDNYAQYNRYSDRPDGLIAGEASGMHTDAGNYETPFGRHEGLEAGGSGGPDAGVSVQGIQDGKVGTHGPGVQRAGTQSSGVSINPFVVGSQTGQVVEDQLVSKTADGDLAIIRGADLFSPQSVSSKYGELSVSQDGHWTFELNNQLQATQQLGTTEQVEEVFNVVSKDGSSHEIHIFIHGTEDNPVITSIAAQSVSEGASLLKGQVGATDVDHGDTLSFSTNAQVAGFQLNPDGSYTFDPTDPAYNNLSEGVKNVLNIPVTVTDSQGGSTTSTLQITVTGTNDAPVMNVVPPQSAVEDGSVIHGRVTGSDVDSRDVLVYGLSRPVAGFTMHPDGSYDFDPSHISYQNIADGDVREIHVPVTLVDSHGAQTTSDLLIRVTGTNDIPTMLVVPAASLHEGDAVFRGQLATMDADSGDTMTYTITQPVAGFQLSQDGSYTFDPTDPAYDHLAPGDSTTLKIPVVVSDGHGGTDTQTLMITVNGTNDKPTVVGQPVQLVTEDGTVRGHLQATDIDDNEHFTFSMPAPVPGLTLNTDGSYTFDASAPDYQHLKQGEPLDLSIPVLVTDSHGGSSVGQINIHITGTNDVPIIGGIDHAIGSVGAAQNGVVHVDGNLNVLDVDTGESSFQPQLIKGTYGALAIDSTGHWSYTADASQKALVGLQGAQSLPEHFEVRTADGTVHGIDIKIMGQNTAAAIGGVSTGMTKEDVVGSASGRMTVTDPNQGESKFVAEDRDTPHGHFRLDADGNWEFTLNNQNPEVQALAESGMLTERITVGSVDGTPHIVTINIVGTNDVPQIAGTASGVVTEDASTTTAVGTLTGSDVDTGAAQVWSIMGADHGTYGSIAVDPNTGQWTYTLDNSLAATQQLAEGQPGRESFTVQVTDEHGAVAMKTVTLTVTGTNDAPTVSSAVTLPGGAEDTAVTLTSAQLLANAADVDQGDLAQLSVANLQADHGTITDNHDGTFTFTPDANYNGPVSFTYDVQDPHGGSVSTSASMSLAAVNDAAVISGDTSGSVKEDQHSLVSIWEEVSGVLKVVDPDAGEAVFTKAATKIDDPFYTSDSFHIQSNGRWTYSVSDRALQNLAEGESHTVVYEVSTADGTKQRINIEVRGTNDRPELSFSGYGHLDRGPHPISTDEDKAVTIPLDRFITATDKDHGATLHLEELKVDHGTATLTADGQGVVFTPEKDYNGQVTFTYYVADEHGLRASDPSVNGARPAVTGMMMSVHAVADAAVIGGDSAKTTPDDDTAVSGRLTVTDPDAGEDHFVAQTDVDGTYGKFSIGVDGHWTYTPDARADALAVGQAPQETFTVHAADGTPHDVTITVTGTNDAPTVTSSVTLASGSEDTAVTLTSAQLLAHASDVDQGETAHLSVHNVHADHGTVADNGDGTFTFTPEANYNGPVSFTYDVQDPHGATVATSASMNLAAIDDAAVITGTGGHLLEEDSLYTGYKIGTSGQLHVVDPDGPAQSQFPDVLHGGIYTGNLGGRLQVNTNGNYFYHIENSAVNHLAEGQEARETFTIHSVDGTTHQVEFVIEGTNDAPYVRGGATLSPGTEDTAVTLHASDLLAQAGDYDDGETAQLTVHGLTAVKPDGTSAGTITDNHDGTFTFNPEANYSGAVTFNYQVQDPHGGSAPAHATLDLASVTDTAAVGIAVSAEQEIVSTGSAGRIVIGDLAAGQPLTEMTMEFTVVGRSAGSGTGSQGPVILNMGDSGHNNMLSLWNPANMKIGGAGDPATGINLADGNSHRITLTWTSASGDLKVFDNGQLVTTVHNYHQGGTLPADAYMVLGQKLNNPGNPGNPGWSAVEHYEGQIFNAAIAGHALTDSQVATAPLATQLDHSSGLIVDVRSVAGQLVDTTGTHILDQQGGLVHTTQQVDTSLTPPPPGSLLHLDVSVTAPADPDDHVTATLLTGLPAGTVVSDGTHSVTFTGTPVDLAGWQLHQITAQLPAHSQNFRVSVDVETTGPDGTVAHSHGDTPIVMDPTQPVPDAQIAGDDTANTDEDSAVSGVLTISDSTASQASFTEQADTHGQYGKFSLSADGHWTYTPDARADGLADGAAVKDSFVVRSLDGTTHTVVVDITGTNDAPVVSSAVTLAAGTEDTAVTINPADLLAHATDIDAGDQAHLSVHNLQVDHGTIVANSDGTFTFTPEANYNGAVTFNYEVQDPQGGAVTTSASMTLAAVADAAAIGGQDQLTVHEDGAASVRGKLTVSDPDAGEEHFVAQMHATGTGGYGHFNILPNGLWIYSPDHSDPRIQELGEHKSLTDSLLVTSADGTQHTVTVTIEGTDDAPIITGDTTAAVTEDSGVNAAGELEAYGKLTVTDIDAGQTPTFVAQQAVAGSNGYGSFSIDATGQWTYTAANSNPAIQGLKANQQVTDSVDVVTSSGETRTLTVTLTGTNDAPTVTAAAGHQTATEDTPLIFSEAAILGMVGATDTDADTLHVTAIDIEAKFGQFNQRADGSWIFTPASQVSGSDLPVTIQVSDGHATTSAQGVLDIAAVADTPTLQVTVDSLAHPSVNSYTSADFSGTGEAIDFDLTASGYQVPGEHQAAGYYSVTTAHGGIADDVFRFSDLQAGQTYQVDGGQGSNILDLSNYHADDVRIDTAAKTVTVTLPDGSTSTINYDNIDQFRFSEQVFDGTPHGLTPVKGQWVAEGAQIESTGGGEMQTSIVNFQGHLAHDYTLAATVNAHHADAGHQWTNGGIVFDYVDDQNFKVAFLRVGMKSWTIESYENGQKHELERVYEPALTTADADHHVELRVHGSVAELWSGGVMKASHDFHEPLNDGLFGVVADRAHTAFELEMQPSDWAPSAPDLEILMGASDGSVTTADVLAQAVDPEGHAVTISDVQTTTSHGGTVVDNGDGTFSYIPAQGFTGQDSFTYEVTDGTNITTATVRVNIANIHTVTGTHPGDAFTVNIGTDSVDSSETLTTRVYGLPDGSVVTDGTHTATVSSGDHLDVSGWALGSLTVTPPPDQTANYQFHVETRSTDGSDTSPWVSTPLQVQLQPHSTSYADATISGDHAQSTDEDSSVSGTLTVIDADAGEDHFTVQTGTDGQYGTFSIDAAGHWTYTPDGRADALQDQASVKETFVVQSADGTVQHVEVTVTGTNDAPLVTATTGNEVDLGATDQGVARTFSEAQLVQLVGATDLEQDTLSITDVAVDPAQGTFVQNANTKEWTFTPAAGFYGDDLVVTLKVSDGKAETTAHGQLDVSATAGQITIDSLDNALEVQTGTSGGHHIHGANHPGNSNRFTPTAFETTSGDVTIHGSATGLPDGTAITVHLVDKLNPRNSFDLHATVSGNSWQATIDHTQIDKVGTHDWTVDATATDLTGATVHATTEIFDEGTLTQSLTEDGAAASLDLLDGAIDMNVENVLYSTDGGSTFSSRIPDGFQLAADGHTLEIDPTASSFDSLADGAQQKILIKFDITETIGTKQEVVHQTASVTVTGTDDAPTVSGADVGQTTEDASFTAVLDVVDPDGAADSGFQPEVIRGKFGMLTIDTDGQWTYKPSSHADSLADGAVVDDKFTVHTLDGTAHTIKVQVTGTNDAPTVSSEVVLASGTEDKHMVIDPADLLANATDLDTSDQGRLSVHNLRADHGSITSNPDGTYTFTPDKDYNGAVHFTYDVQDPHGGVVHTGATTNLVDVPDAVQPAGLTGSQGSGHVWHATLTRPTGATGDWGVQDPVSHQVGASQHGSYGSLQVDPSTGQLTYVADKSGGVHKSGSGMNGEATEHFIITLGGDVNSQIEVDVHLHAQSVHGGSGHFTQTISVTDMDIHPVAAVQHDEPPGQPDDVFSATIEIADNDQSQDDSVSQYASIFAEAGADVHEPGHGDAQTADLPEGLSEVLADHGATMHDVGADHSLDAAAMASLLDEQSQDQDHPIDGQHQDVEHIPDDPGVDTDLDDPSLLHQEEHHS